MVKKLEKQKIIVADNAIAVTGGMIAIRNATSRLRNAYDFEYVLPVGSTARVVLEQDGYHVHELPFVEISRRKRDLLLYIPMLLINGWRLYRLAKRQGASIIHLNDFYNLTGYLAKACSLGRLRVVTHVRFLPQSLVQPLARTWRWFGETFADRMLCVSEAVRQYFSVILQVQVVFDPIPVQERYPAPVLPAQQPDGTVRMLYLGNYIPGKGQNFAVKAFQKAYAQLPTLRLHFAGGDMGLEKNREFRRQLEGEVQVAGLQQVVTFGGFVQDVEAAIKQADVVLNFSESESFSLTCLDALYFGTALIASDCGGPAELFESGKSGLLVPNRDVEAMAEAMVTLGADSVLRQRFAAAGREFVRHKFSPAATYEKLGRVYAELLAEKK